LQNEARSRLRQIKRLKIEQAKHVSQKGKAMEKSKVPHMLCTGPAALALQHIPIRESDAMFDLKQRELP
jgi:hypothetical protein